MGQQHWHDIIGDLFAQVAGIGGGDVANYAATPLVDIMRITNFISKKILLKFL